MMMVLFLELLYPKSMKAVDLLNRKAGKSDGLLKKKKKELDAKTTDQLLLFIAACVIHAMT